MVTAGPIPRLSDLRRRTRVLALLLALVVPLLICESLTAVFFLTFSRHYYRPRYLLSESHFRWRTEFHEWGVWHQRNGRASHRTPCFDVGYRSNSVGARDREHPMRVTGRRILFLGDSFFEGWGVEEDARLSNLVEQRLGVETLNFGVAGYVGPLQYWLLYEELASRFDHTDLVVGFLPWNDFTDNDPEYSLWRNEDTRYRPYWKRVDGGFTHFHKGTSREGRTYADLYRENPDLGWRGYFWSHGLFLAQKGQLAPRSIDITMDMGNAGYFESDPARIDAALFWMRRIVEDARLRRVIVLIIPNYSEAMMLRKGARSPWIGRFTAELSDAGAQVVDLASTQAALTEPAIRECHLECDGHWSEAGNRLAADVLGPYLVSR